MSFLFEIKLETILFMNYVEIVVVQGRWFIVEDFGKIRWLYVFGFTSFQKIGLLAQW